MRVFVQAWFVAQAAGIQAARRINREYREFNKDIDNYPIWKESVQNTKALAIVTGVKFQTLLCNKNVVEAKIENVIDKQRPNEPIGLFHLKRRYRTEFTKILDFLHVYFSIQNIFRLNIKI